jgi:hypothetical protein
LHNFAPEGSLLYGRGLIAWAYCSILGFQIPNMLLSSRITRRQKEIRKAMPDALDLLTICVEAGLGFDAAMQKVYEKWDNELARAFGRVIREIQLGKLRRDALRDMANRLGWRDDQLRGGRDPVRAAGRQHGARPAHPIRPDARPAPPDGRRGSPQGAHQDAHPDGFVDLPFHLHRLMTPAVLMFLKSGFWVCE